MISLFYLALSLIGLIGAGITYWKSDHKAELLILMAFATSVILLADWIAYGMLDMYDYMPGLSADKFVDSVMGEFLAEAVFIPSLVGVLMPRFSGLAGMLIGTSIVVVLELFMTNLGIYNVRSWVVGLTGILFVVYFAALHLFWHDLTRRNLPEATVRAILRATLVFYVLAHLTLFLRAQQWVITQTTLLPTYQGNQSFGRFLTYALIAGPAGYWALCGQGSWRWVRILLATIGLALVDVGLISFGIQHFVPPWNPAFDALAQGAGYSLAALAETAIMSLYAREQRQLT